MNVIDGFTLLSSTDSFNEPSPYSKRKQVLGFCGLLMGLFAAYWPSLNGAFFHFWDDARWLRDVATLAQESGGLARLWTDLGAVEQYYPLTATSFWLDHHWWSNWPLPYHVENVLLHGVSAALILLLMRRLGLPGGWLAAGVFALHPMMVESVAWITERKNVLSLPFFLGALLASGGFASWADRQAAGRKAWWASYTLTGTLFVAAMLAKVSAFVFPALVPLLGWWRHGRLEIRRDGLPMLPLVLVAGGLSLVVHHVEVNLLGSGEAFPVLTPLQQLLLAGRIPWFYAAQFFWPRQLCVMYPSWEIDTTSAWQWLYPLASLAVLVAAWRLRHRYGRGPLTLLLAYGGSLFPVLGFFKVYGMVLSWVADRWAYLPVLALLLPSAAMLARWSARFPWPIRATALMALLSILGAMTWQSSTRFRDERALWESALTVNPKCWPAFNNLGNLADKEGRHEEAMRWFSEGLRFDPGNTDMENNLANAWLKVGMPERAIEKLRELASRAPKKAVVRHNLGLAYMQIGAAEQALTAFDEALRLDPGFLASQLKRADLLLALGRQAEAETQYLAVLEQAPRQADALVSLGNLHFNRNQHTEALDYYERTLEALPGDPVALNNLAWLLATTPNASLRDPERAVGLAKAALEATKEPMPEYRQTLAFALAGCQRFAEAAETAAFATDEAKKLNKLGLADQLSEMTRQMRSRMDSPPSSPSNPAH